jgi:hypothetical protein
MHVAGVAYVHASEQQAQDNLKIIQETAMRASTRATMRGLTQAWDEIPGGRPAEVLQSAFISDNPYPREVLTKASAIGLQSYNEAHEPFHIFAKSLVDRYHYYDVFLIDTRGNVVYSYFKEPDFASNLLSSNTALAKSFREALGDPSKISATEFEPYEPSKWSLARFMTVGIEDAECTARARSGTDIAASSCKLLGVLGLQIPADFAAAAAESDFNTAKDAVAAAMVVFWELHNNLIYVYKTSYEDLTVSFNTCMCALAGAFTACVQIAAGLQPQAAKCCPSSVPKPQRGDPISINGS